VAVIDIVLVEDDPRYVNAVRETLRGVERYKISAEFDSVEACRQAIVVPQSIWLIDLGLPGPLQGLELIAPLVAHNARVLVMTVFEDEMRVITAMQAGAQGYYIKGDGNLLKAIHEIDRGQVPLSPKIATHLLKAIRSRDAGPQQRQIFSSDLSPRELETLQALAHGYSYREVATRHRVSYHTVGDHVKSIYKKLQVNTKTAAIKVALRRGILSLNEI